MPQLSPEHLAKLAAARSAAAAKRRASANITSPLRVKSSTETDEQIKARLAERFSALSTMTTAVFEGVSRALIVSGPPGLGKSFCINQIAEQYIEGDKGRKISFVHGFTRATGVYKALYEHRNPGDVLIYDDADTAFYDDNGAMLLKHACDTTKKRQINWSAETNMSDATGETLPTQFDFEGAVIFITNTDFDAVIEKGNKIAMHLEALISRSVYLDLTIRTRQDYIVRIEQVVAEGLLKGLVNWVDQYELIEWLKNHIDKVRELSLRTVLKLATFKRMDANNWKSLARVICLKQ